MGIITNAHFDLIGRMITLEVTATIAGNEMQLTCGSSIDEVKQKGLPFFTCLSQIASEKLGIDVQLNEELKNFIELC